MNKYEALKYVKGIKEDIDVFLPSEDDTQYPTLDDGIPVYASIIKEPMDREENVRGDQQLFCFEVFTEKQLSYLEKNPDDRKTICYFFTALLSSKDLEFSSLMSLAENNQPFNYKTYIMYNRDSYPSTGVHHIDGRLSISFPIESKHVKKLWEDKIPFFFDVTLCWTDAITASSNGIPSPEIVHSRIVSIINSERHNNANNNSKKKLPTAPSRKSANIWIRVYAVGGGNAIYIVYPDSRTILFDCGLDLYSPKAYKEALLKIIDLKPTTVIISHWHLDHYCLLNFIDSSNLQHIIMRNEDNMSDYAHLILDDIVKRSGAQKYIIDKLPSGQFDKDWLINYFQYQRTNIFLGHGVQGQPYIGYDNSINDRSIILSIGDQWKRSILPSDASYYSWPHDSELDLTECAKLVIPHHGGSIYTIPTPAKNILKYKNAYISSHFDPMKLEHKKFLDSFMVPPVYSPFYQYTKSVQTKNNQPYLKFSV